MKKTRILAALLCMMMVLTMVPMMASAAETTYDSIEDILGFGVAGKTYAFTASNAQSLYGAGVSGNALYEGSTLSAPAALKVKGNNATGILLVVTYKGDDMAKAQIFDAATLTAEGTVVDASADGATKVKVFLWDNFTNLNPQNPAITLGL